MRPNRATTAQQVEESLLLAIIDGTIKPSTPLRLQDIAQRLGTSMMPVREAIRQLEFLGLVEVHAHKGAWVRPATRTDLLDTYFTRAHLETIAIREAARRFTLADAESARRALDAQLEAGAIGDAIETRNAHDRFHFALYGACGSTWLVRSLLPAWRNSERYRIYSMRHPEDRDRRRREHNSILDALIARDEDRAAEALVHHLSRSIELALEGLPTDDDEEEVRGWERRLAVLTGVDYASASR